MLFEQNPSLLTPSIINNIDGGLGGSCTNPFLSSLDFLLLDDIDLYLPSKKSKNEYLFNTNNCNPIDDDSNNDNNSNSQSFFEDIDLNSLAHFDGNEEKSELIPSSDVIDWDIEKWISQAAFPSPPMDSINSPVDPNESFASSPSTIPWVGEEYTIQSQSSVPPSPPPSSIDSSSPAPMTKKSNRTKKSGISTVERKIRKKSQNKTAAEKYRIKKSIEKSQVTKRHMQLTKMNRDLKLETENLTFRVQQLKQLFVDLLQIQLPSTSS